MKFLLNLLSCYEVSNSNHPFKQTIRQPYAYKSFSNNAFKKKQ